jgi:hypothetical protein
MIQWQQLHGNKRSEIPVPLWILSWNALQMVRPAFTRTRTFLWFATIVAGFAVRTEHLGVTSIVRALKLRPNCYEALLDNLHTAAVRLDQLSALWTRAVLQLFPNPLLINGRRVLVGDGIKAPKSGKKMPGVKLLHQQSESNNKPDYVMAHSLQAVGVLVQVTNSVLAVPLKIRIEEGLVWSNRDRRTLLDKMLTLLNVIAVPDPFYFVGDAYYAAGKMAIGLIRNNNHLITRVKSNAVAYEPYIAQGAKKRGRPRLYGPKIALKTLLNDSDSMEQAPSPVYGEQNVTLHFHVRDLLWRPTGRLVRFVALVHPTRGSCLLMSTDTTLSAIDIIRAYGLRFKIEHTFKQAVHVIGTFSYHFWMKSMTPLRRGSGNQYLHRKSPEYRDAVKRKMNAYHLFIQAGVISQGLLQYLAAVASTQVWSSFGSWLRTIRPGVAPSELVVASALRQTLPQFLLNNVETASIAKFIVERQNPETMEMFSLAS